MTAANEIYEAIMQELNGLVISHAELEAEEEEESFYFHEDEDSEEIPSSLLSYFETSKRRAAACEKLIHEEDEDFAASHLTEDLITDCDDNQVTLTEQVISEVEYEEKSSSADTSLHPDPAEACLTYNTSACLSNE
ncbi:hypothetical protein LDENG_00193910, partial [Lucifuga dentata]